MTVPYTYDISTATYLHQWRLFFHWRGSLWKSVYIEVGSWIIIYFILTCVYRYALNDHQQSSFDKVVMLLYKLNDRIPLTFMLGFYVTNVASRWWNIILNVGFTDNMILIAQNYISEADQRAKFVKRTLVRYMCLVQILVYRTCSRPIAKLYPTKESLVEAGYLESSETDKIMEEVFWVPLNWAMSLVGEAREHGLIASDKAVQRIYTACIDFYKQQLMLSVYNWIPVPLGYTQVVFLAVRAYFVVAVVARQHVPSKKEIDLWFPFQTVFQMILYIGWLTVAEAMLNPLGDDDDDFDSEFWMNRNFEKALEIFSESGKPPPPMATLAGIPFEDESPKKDHKGSAETVYDNMGESSAGSSSSQSGQEVK